MPVPILESSGGGGSIDYVNVTRAATAYTTTANAAYLFDTIQNGNIPYNTATGRFTLTAGKTYELLSSLRASGTGSITYRWFNVTSGTSFGTSAINLTMTNAVASSVQPVATGIFTPSVNTIVELRPTTAFQTNAIANNSFATIKQLGTSATILTPISILHLENQGATAQLATIAAAGIGIGIRWFASLFTKGSKITWTSNNGTITLAGGINGTTYRLTGKVATTGSTDASGSYVFYRFYNVTTTIQIGSEGYTTDPDNGANGVGWNEIPSPLAYAYITVAAGITQQIRLAITASSATPGTIRQQAGQTSVSIEEIEG